MFKDRTNIKYGYLTALEYLGKSKWLCQCDCGNTKIVYGGHLESGHTKSCGCQQNKGHPKDLVGQRFGKLIVQSYAGNGQWACLCDCGQTTTVSTGNLKTGNTQSCGCLHKEVVQARLTQSLIGQRFGKLLVIEQMPSDETGTIYKCQCDCGGVTITHRYNLIGGNTNSCGCIKSKGEMFINLWLQEHHINFMPQYTFQDIYLSSGRKPFYDFAIFNSNKQLYCIIEYNGQQHYEYNGRGWNTEENFLKTQQRDLEKTVALQERGIPLYIINYKDDIPTELNKILAGIAKVNENAVDMEDAEEATNE